MNVVGLKNKNMEEGYFKGEKCNRGDCKGIINEHDKDGGCSCFDNPPCSYCTEPNAYCPECEWSEEEDTRLYDKAQKIFWEEYYKRPDVIEAKEKAKAESELFYKMYHGDIPVDKYRVNHRGHTHFSQILYGVHPNMTREEILKDVKGTFGGRFTKFNDYSFEYIAYTD